MPGSAVGIVTGYGLDGPGIESWWGRDFPNLFRSALGPTQLPVQWVTSLSPGVNSGRVVTLTPHALLVPWSWKGRAIPLLPLWSVRPVQSLSACTRLHFTFIFGHERIELYLYSPYWPYGLYRASVPVQGWPLPLPLPSVFSCRFLCPVVIRTM